MAVTLRPWESGTVLLLARLPPATGEIERYVDALTDTAARRHRLPVGTPEYEAALDQEERLMARIWRLGTSRVRDAVTVEGGARTREPG